MMSSRSTKITVDILMSIFLILSFVRWEDHNAVFHLAVGTACALFFAIHVCIHRKWLKAVTKSCLAVKLNRTLKWKYIINILLLAVWSIAIVTGFLAIGSFAGGIEWMLIFGRIHGITSRLGLALVIIHAIQHREQIVSYFKVFQNVSK